MSSKALSGFRKLLRASRHVFRDDHRAVNAARLQLRTEFLRNKDEKDVVSLEELFQGVDEVEEMLRFNIVQGSLNERGNYAVRLTEENQTSIESRNDEPLGTEFEPVDQSLMGRDSGVKVEKVKPTRSPFEPVKDL
jgi:hypothetical protein